MKHEKLYPDDLRHYIQQKLGLYWSPEQVSGRLRMEENIRISTETIYRMILKDKVAGGSLYLSLRHQSKKYRKRYGKNDYRVDIADRPSVMDSRSRIGDWEADCVIGTCALRVKVIKAYLPPWLNVKADSISP